MMRYRTQVGRSVSVAIQRSPSRRRAFGWSITATSSRTLAATAKAVQVEKRHDPANPWLDHSTGSTVGPDRCRLRNDSCRIGVGLTGQHRTNPNASRTGPSTRPDTMTAHVSPAGEFTEDGNHRHPWTEDRAWRHIGGSWPDDSG